MEIRKRNHLESMLGILNGYRYLLCVDLEATCDECPEYLSQEDSDCYQLAVKREDMETIEVGAIIIDLQSDCKIVGEFSKFVSPVLNPLLTPFCKQLTSITQADVDNADPYADVKQYLDEFLIPFAGQTIWCSWDDYDLQQLAMDAKVAGITPMLAGLEHTNIKRWHWKIFDCRAMGLRPAVESLGIKWQGSYHRAIDDARNLSALVVQLLKLSEPALPH